MGYIDVGDGCWRPNVLVASLRCWWPIQDVGDRFNTLRKSPTTKKVANITILSPTSWIGHHHKTTNVTLLSTSLSQSPGHFESGRRWFDLQRGYFKTEKSQYRYVHLTFRPTQWPIRWDWLYSRYDAKCTKERNILETVLYENWTESFCWRVLERPISFERVFEMVKFFSTTEWWIWQWVNHESPS